MGTYVIWVFIFVMGFVAGYIYGRSTQSTTQPKKEPKDKYHDIIVNVLENKDYAKMIITVDGVSLGENSGTTEHMVRKTVTAHLQSTYGYVASATDRDLAAATGLCRNDRSIRYVNVVYRIRFITPVG